MILKKGKAVLLFVGTTWGAMSAILSMPPSIGFPYQMTWMPSKVLFPSWLCFAIAEHLPAPLMGPFMTRSGWELQGALLHVVFFVWCIAFGILILFVVNYIVRRVTEVLK
jgi:hypothetical protein